jgi:chaperonin cofactor prefoldin
MTIKKNKTVKEETEVSEVIREIELPEKVIKEISDIEEAHKKLPEEIQQLYKLRQTALSERMTGILKALAAINDVNDDETVQVKDGKLIVTK